MLDYFKVPKEDVVIVNVDNLRRLTEQMFIKCGVKSEEARIGSDVLMHADLRGIQTHGVSNLLRGYIQGYNSGQINPNPKWKIIRIPQKLARGFLYNAELSY